MEPTNLAQGLRRSQVLQRLQLELTLDTIPRDSCYSAQLIDLMKREELALRDSPTSATTSELVSRVDDALRTETGRFFSKSVTQNVKKWAALQKKMEQEIERLGSMKKPVDNQVAQQRVVTYEVGGRSYPIPTSEDLDRETHRLSGDYNENWTKYEDFNLKSAFMSQIARVENDWIAQEMSLTDEFNARKAQMQGTTVESPTRQHTSSDRWQHPEKQKTLIHTAPVMSPTIRSGSREDAPSADVRLLRTPPRPPLSNCASRPPPYQKK